MSKRCILNVAVGGWYPRGLKRLRDSLQAQGFKGDFIGWENNYPPGCPPHGDVPDAFVGYSFKDAIEKGYTSILWLDASCWAIRPVEPIFEHFEEHGHLFYNNGHNIGEWCKDSACERLHLDREKSFSMPDMTGMFMGIDYTQPAPKAWMDEFIDVTVNSPETLQGPFPRCQPGEISTDPRVKGHAHEQTVAGALAYHHGLGFTPQPNHFLQVKYPQDEIRKEAIILAAGM